MKCGETTNDGPGSGDASEKNLVPIYSKMRQEEGSPLRLEYWWNCDDPNNIVIETPEGGTTYLDFDFTDVDDVP